MLYILDLFWGLISCFAKSESTRTPLLICLEDSSWVQSTRRPAASFGRAHTSLPEAEQPGQVAPCRRAARRRGDSRPGPRPCPPPAGTALPVTGGSAARSAAGVHPRPACFLNDIDPPSRAQRCCGARPGGGAWGRAACGNMPGNPPGAGISPPPGPGAQVRRRVPAPPASRGPPHRPGAAVWLCPGDPGRFPPLLPARLKERRRRTAPLPPGPRRSPHLGSARLGSARRPAVPRLALPRLAAPRLAAPRPAPRRSPLLQNVQPKST